MATKDQRDAIDRFHGAWMALGDAWLDVLNNVAADADGVGPIAVPEQEAARLVGVSPSTIRRLVDDGQLPVRHIGRRRIILRAELEALVQRLPLA